MTSEEWISLDDALRLYAQRMDVPAEEFLPHVNRENGEKTLDVYLRDAYFVAYRIGEGYFLDRRMFDSFLKRVSVTGDR